MIITLNKTELKLSFGVQKTKRIFKPYSLRVKDANNEQKVAIYYQLKKTEKTHKKNTYESIF